MDITRLQYFKVIAEQKNITRAAEILKITQPALSIAITNLEKELGVPLIIRQGRGIVLNEYGRIFLKHAEAILAEHKEAVRKINEKKHLNDQTIRLGVNGSTFPQRILMSFGLVYPAICVEQTLLRNDELNDAMKDKNLDLMLLSESASIKGLHSRMLFQERYLVAVPKSHRLADRKTVSINELRDELFVLMPRQISSRQQINRIFEKAGFEPRVLQELMLEQMITFLNAGVAITVLSESNIALNHAEYSNIKFLQLEEKYCKRDISLYWKNDADLPEAAEKFRSFVIENILDINKNSFLEAILK